MKNPLAIIKTRGYFRQTSKGRRKYLRLLEVLEQNQGSFFSKING